MTLTRDQDARERSACRTFLQDARDYPTRSSDGVDLDTGGVHAACVGCCPPMQSLDLTASPLIGESVSNRPLPAADYLVVPDEGDPYLQGSRCSECDAVFLGDRAVCGRCGGRGTMRTERLSDRGILYSYSIVHRSFPGIVVPFVSAVVDLDGGGTVKGNLVDVNPTPEAVVFDMPVQVVYRDALGRLDSAGKRYLAFFFTPLPETS